MQTTELIHLLNQSRKMEAIIFTGIQASGKSTFYRDRFCDSHIRINLDMLKTRHREKILLHACLEAKQPFVVDNTNPTREDRQRYIVPAKQYGFRIVSYYFQANLEDCKQRNLSRTAKLMRSAPQKIVPLVGLISTAKRLVKPLPCEGFDAIYSVAIATENTFSVEELSHEV